MIRSLIVILFACCAAWGQINAPLLGYLPDGGRIRPAYGIPGASAVSGAIDLGRELAQISVSPRQDYVLGAAADTGEALLIRPGLGATNLDGVAAGADRIVMSPRGGAAAFWFSATGHIQIVAGLPGSPSIREIDASFLPNPAALAVSDDGQWLAGAWPDGTYTFGPDAQVNRLQVDSGVVSLAFFHQRPDLVLATPTRVISIADIGGQANPNVLYDNSDQPLNPVGIALSFDNRLIVVAGRAGLLLAIDLNTGASATVDCGCAPEGLFGLGGSAFRLTGLNNGAFKLFDAAAGAVLFSPLAADAPGQAGGQL